MRIENNTLIQSNNRYNVLAKAQINFNLFSDKGTKKTSKNHKYNEFTALAVLVDIPEQSTGAVPSKFKYWLMIGTDLANSTSIRNEVMVNGQHIDAQRYADGGVHMVELDSKTADEVLGSKNVIPEDIGERLEAYLKNFIQPIIAAKASGSLN